MHRIAALVLKTPVPHPYLGSMIELKLNDRTYDLPESWDEVTLGQYVDILNARLDKMVSTINARIKCIALMSSDPKQLESDIKHLDTFDLNDLLVAFDWMNVDPDYSKLAMLDTLVVDGRTFKIKKDFNKLSVNEMIIIEELNQNERIDAHHFEIAFGVLFREVDDEGKEKDITVDGLFQQIKDFRDKVYLKDVFGVLAFFLNGGTEPYSQTLQSSSTHQMKMTLTKKVKN